MHSEAWPLQGSAKHGKKGLRAANTTQQIAGLRLRRGAKPQAVQEYDKASLRRIKGCVSGSNHVMT